MPHGAIDDGTTPWAKPPISARMFIYQQEHGDGSGGWYTVTADEDGIPHGPLFLHTILGR
jgi:hypothetical protein